MKKFYIIFFLLILCHCLYPQTYNGTIIRVVDGDTFVFQTTEGSFKVRMNGIDAPEKDQSFGRESTEFLSKFIYKEAILKVSGVDQYGRQIGTLSINGQDINLFSIKSGCSWHYKKYSKDIDYANAEEYAKTNKLGLWALPNPIPPWEWRHRK